MAKTTIGLGFMRTEEQAERLRKAGEALPETWTVDVSGGPASSQSPGIFDVAVAGPSFGRKVSFGPDGIEGAIAFLEGLLPKT